MTQEQLIEKATGFYPILGIKYKSPFRKDRTAGAFFLVKGGKWRWYDYGHPELNGGDCFDLLHYKLYGKPVSNKEDLEKVKTEINYVPSEEFEFILKWEQGAPKPYWHQYGITDFERDGVFGCQAYMHNTRKFPKLLLRKTPSDPCFAITHNGKVAIYRPYQPKGKKHLSNFGHNDVKELAGNGRTALVVGSYKDGKILNNFTGMPVLITLSESAFPDDFEIARWLLNYDKFIIIFDNDDAGIRSSLTFQKILCKFAPALVITPQGKDPGEMMEAGNIMSLVNTINERDF